MPASSGDVVAERARLATAIEDVRRQLLARAGRMDGVRRGVLDAHLALLGDPELVREAEDAIDGGHGAGVAWRDTLARAAEALARLGDPRMAERRADLLDLERQVLRAMAGSAAHTGPVLPERAIVLAGELLPSQLLSLDTSRIAGLCTAGGGATSHVAILAASLGLPMLVAAGPAVLEIADGTTLVLDADVGRLHVAPGGEELAGVERRIAELAQRSLADAEFASQPASLRDGTSVRVDANLGAVEEAVPALQAGADGCGLLRTEFLYLERDAAPTEDEQLAVYQALADALEGRPLTIRTLDAGGDKPIPFLPMPKEENPALGLRGVRTSLASPVLFDAQLRALLRVRADRGCRILLPMVTDPADVRAVRERIARLAGELGVAMPALGAMIETPASAMLADQIAPLVDFFSIGSNDLSQYVLAIDRLHPTLASRLDALHPAVLRTIAVATAVASARGIEVCVCGGLASDPEAVPLLLALGARELSVVPSMIGRIKSVVRTLSLADCDVLLRRAMALDGAAAVRAQVREFMSGRATLSGAE
jgi:phosphoenolpyruvate-protein phosphotransferase